MYSVVITDQNLLLAIAQKQQDALHTLYSRYYQRIYHYLWIALEKDSGWAEDIVQETFLCVWYAAPNYRGDASVATWLFCIAHHQAYQARRKHYGLSFLLDKTHHDQELALVAARSSLEDEVVRRVDMREAIQRLSPKYRMVLELLFIQGFSLAETARILQIPVGTVKSRLNYARRTLTTMMQPEEVVAVHGK
jgi:RNA polymerase sigma-70 factor (ECF subfamily)